jgi:hypothetical protein
MQTLSLLASDAQAVNDVSTVVTPPLNDFREGLFQLGIDSGTGTVAIQGRLLSTLPWETIQTLSADDAVTVALFPFMRTKCTVSSTLVATAAILV